MIKMGCSGTLNTLIITALQEDSGGGIGRDITETVAYNCI